MAVKRPVSAGDLVVRALDADTWPAFARLVEANNGVWGGCWCMGFHVAVKGRTAAQNRADKEQRVRADRTHAALVFDGDDCLGWCQFGSPDEFRWSRAAGGTRPTCRPCRTGASPASSPAWTARSRGADAALGGALADIARRGGGTVEGYPEETDDRSVSGSFLHTGPMPAFENHGFHRTRQISPHRWVVTLVVDAA